MADVSLMVNGRSYSFPEIPNESLADLLRQRLHLTGTKIGCGEGHCGVCTMLLDGKPVKSCRIAVSKAIGKNILTIEGLQALSPTPGSLHPLQDAFIQYGSIQCGFCTPAQIMQAYAYLQSHPDPSYEELKGALKNVLCRCGAYEAILQAVLAAAYTMRTGQPLPTPKPQSVSAHTHVIGTPQPRPDALAKATGSAIYTDDLSFPGMLYARVLRAGVPHAILTKIDTSAAKALQGVHAVLTASDLPAAHVHGLFTKDWPILVGVGERIRYMGDALALIAAETQAIADQAVKLITFEVDPQPVLSNPQAALQPDAPQLHPNGNLLKHIKVRKGDVDQGFAQADVILEHTFHTPFTDHLFMEPECSIAVPLPDGRMEVYVGSQIPYADREQVAAALGVAEEHVRIRGQLTGGGFGGKEDIAGQIHAALLAQATGKPVKLLFTRRESLLVHPKRHATQIRVKLGAKRNGMLVAAETELFGDTGAYASLGEKVMTRATTHSVGPYIIPSVKSDCYAVYTNNPPAGAFRGFGVLQSAFAIESMMDILAHELGMDPLALRKLNALRVGSQTNTGQLLEESVGLLDCLSEVKTHLHRIAGPQPFKPQQIRRNGKDYITCWGVAAAYKNTGLGGNDSDKGAADVELRLDGSLQVRSAAAEIGQGLVTVLRLLVAETMNRDPEDVDVLVMDTGLTPESGPTTASRQTFVTGNAALLAARDLRQHLLSTVAAYWNIPTNRIELTPQGAVCTPDPQEQFDNMAMRNLNWQQLATLLDRTSTGRSIRRNYIAPRTFELGEGNPIHFAFSFSAQAVQIEVCLESGEIKVLQVISAHDAGRVLNPLGFQGQVEGGVVMGLGHALMEEFKVEDGIIQTDRIARYRIPTMQDSPKVISNIEEHPISSGPFGAKGVGEIVSIPTPPAITNALYHAIGLRVDSLPVHAAEVLAYLRTIKQSKAAD
ncbi:MAG TPA: aldehyde oxidoreductase [Anaerolineaceae bacterium]|nr:aldehyde oxidoreductase [Anaerolineaceae bacterium]